MPVIVNCVFLSDAEASAPSPSTEITLPISKPSGVESTLRSTTHWSGAVGHVPSISWGRLRKDGSFCPCEKAATLSRSSASARTVSCEPSISTAFCPLILRIPSKNFSPTTDSTPLMVESVARSSFESPTVELRLISIALVSRRYCPAVSSISGAVAFIPAKKLMPSATIATIEKNLERVRSIVRKVSFNKALVILNIHLKSITIQADQREPVCR